MADSTDSFSINMETSSPAGKEHLIKTANGFISVAIFGDPDKPALITYPDIALNCMSCFQGLFLCPEAFSLLLHNFCIYHINPPGHEWGAAPVLFDDPVLSADDLADQVAEVLDYFGLGAVMCLGVTAGAYVLTLFAIKYTQRVIGLILVSPLCKTPSWSEWLLNKSNHLTTCGCVIGMTKITDLEASLEQLKSDSLAYQEATANRFNRMQESIDKNKAKADRQFAELLQLLKNIQPPTTIAPPTTHPNYLHPPSAATPLFSRPPSNPNPNPWPLPHPSQPSPPVGYPNQPPPPPNHTTLLPPPNQITHPPLPPINQPLQQSPPFVPPKPPTALPNPTPPPSINLPSQPPPNQTLQPSRTTTLGYGALNLRGFGLFLFFGSVHITRKGLQNEDHYIWDPGITPGKFIKPHLEDKVLSNFLYYYGMCGLVKELLLMRYFSKEVRGGSIVPEADMVQCCRRSLDEMQSLNVLRFLKALNGRMDITDGLKRLQCRTLIFVGENSPFHIESLHMTSKLDGRFSALVEVGRCGSVVTEEQPDAMLMPLEYFLMGYGVYRPSELNISPRSPLSPTSISPDLYNPESMGLKLKPIKTRVSSSKS